MKTFYEQHIKEIKNKPYNNGKRVKLFTDQYLQKGFSDDDTWDLSGHIAELLLPRLRRYKELADQIILIDFPLDEMINGFEAYEEAEFEWSNMNDEQFKRLQNGLDAFAKHFHRLWW